MSLSEQSLFHNFGNDSVNTLSEFLTPENSDNCNQWQSYFTSHDFNVNLNRNFGDTDFKDLFSCLHINCRSLVGNYDNVISSLSCLDFKFPVIGLSETWLQDNALTAIYSFTGYTFIGQGHRCKRGGGVGFFFY